MNWTAAGLAPNTVAQMVAYLVPYKVGMMDPCLALASAVSMVGVTAELMDLSDPRSVAMLAVYLDP